MRSIANTSIVVEGMSVSYESPTIGQVEFAWDTPFKVVGETIQLHNYSRFDNPYCQAEFNSQVYPIQYNDLNHTLDFESV